MSDYYDGYVKCPHCGHRMRGSKLSLNTKTHKRKCVKCRKKFVIFEEVKRYIMTAGPASYEGWRQVQANGVNGE